MNIMESITGNLGLTLLTAVIITVVIFLIIQQIKRRPIFKLNQTSEESKNKDKKEKKALNALIMDVKNEDFGLEYIENPPGRRYPYIGKAIVYWLYRDIEGNIKPVPELETMDSPPEDCYAALHIKEAVRKGFGSINMETHQKIRIGMIALVGVAAMMFTYMLVSG